MTHATQVESKESLIRPCTWVWAMLVLLTGVTLAIGKLQLSGFSVISFILILTLIKTQMVADWFMGLRRVRPLWRLIVTAYLVIVISGIALAYYLSMDTSAGVSASTLIQDSNSGREQ